jgi:muconate cycloisomerase
MTFSHAEASRSVCDSYILALNDGKNSGYGELILRSYVNDPDKVLDSDKKISDKLSDMITLASAGNTDRLTPDELKNRVHDIQWKKHELPLLAAIEGALLDLLCRSSNTDIYNLLGLPLQRETLVYGGVLPILSDDAMAGIIRIYQQISIPYMRVKLSKDLSYNKQVLKTVRESFGTDFDIRVDVNCAWDVETTVNHIKLLETSGVSLVEEPVGADREKMVKLASLTEGSGISYVADESAVSFDDLDRIAADKTFSMLNLRLAKNGGLLRVLELSKRADAAGLKYQLGSHVGETGILSVMGRIAASLMKNPVYIDGSFDDYLLSDNITTESYTFGNGGKAPVITGKKMGYDIDISKLGKGIVIL